MNRRLYRSRTDTVLGGVASGLADYLNADPALVRIAWAILVPLTGGAAFLAYIVGWIVIPEAPKDVGAPLAAASTAGEGSFAASSESESGSASPSASRLGGGNAGVWVGLGLVAIGAYFLVREYLPDFSWNLVWPIVIVGVGVLILVSATRRREG
jgi:phage shock protein C